MARPDPGLSLYIHVPFCTDKCLYCDFYSVPSRSVPSRVQAAVIEQTLEQSRHFLAGLGGAQRIETIFIGGGTPSVLSPASLEKLLAPFSACRYSEWTVEANPESLDERFLDLCADAGVTRLSLGIQTLQDRHLRLLRRPATRQVTLAALDLVRHQWKGQVSVDFIAGIPDQTETEVRADLHVIDELGPGHVSLYQLTCEPGTALAALVESGEVALNPPERDEDLWFAGVESLEGRGYRQYEVSNFALPGRECRHNVRYWRMDPYLGAGPGSVSTLPAASLADALDRPDLVEMPGMAARLTNPKNIMAFLKGRQALWGMDVEILEWPELLLENLMMGLRLEEGIRREVFEDRFGVGFEALFPGLWESWETEGWAFPAGPQLRLTRQGRLVLNTVLHQVAERMPWSMPEGAALQWP